MRVAQAGMGGVENLTGLDLYYGATNILHRAKEVYRNTTSKDKWFDLGPGVGTDTRSKEDLPIVLESISAVLPCTTMIARNNAKNTGCISALNSQADSLREEAEMASHK
ncbi:jg20818 [Pararge aegeria aegeria]|uniref:Jg20818 protein n=1 Tax=Pararge aegeria aegeria TaxID=348720 RepID=A0A8S4R8D3_9NEOP|nr:jg20818 [Pararge aegeria aegeria]